MMLGIARDRGSWLYLDAAVDRSLISKKDWIEQPIVFESNFLKPDRRHIGRTQTMNFSEHVEKYTR